MTLRFLSRRDVLDAGGGEIGAAIADVRAALALLRAGAAEMPPENSVSLGPEPGHARAYALPARVGAAAGVKWTAHRPPVDDGDPSILGVTLVNDAASGRLRGIVESALLTLRRTAAVSALALEALAPVPLRHIAVLGAGAQAESHLDMLASRFGSARLHLWNRSPARAEALGRTAKPPVQVHAALDDALRDADAVLSCTDAAAPFLPEAAMRPGRIVLQVGRHEAPFGLIDRADAVVVDGWGGFADRSAKSLFQMYRAGRFAPESVAATLADALAGEWRPAPGSAVYFSSFGLNVLDIALAARVLRLAEVAGIGTALSLSGGTWAAR